MNRQKDIETTVRKNQWFKKGMVVWRGRRFGCIGGGEAADGSNMIYNLQILHQQSNYFTIHEYKNVMNVIILQH